jgi:hypothetical protein
MDCPHCGRLVFCAACGSPVQEAARDIQLDGGGTTADPAPAAPADKTFLIVARGHGELLDQLKEVVGDLGWVRLVEDRRRDETILPREGREGTMHVDRETP